MWPPLPGFAPLPPLPSPLDPIGVFDSGVGGLSVLREIRRELPSEDLVYVADSRHAPYGERSAEEIAARAVAVTEFLLGERAKAIVVACNTATGAAVRQLRARFEQPIIAMEPAVKPAVSRTRTGVVGVLATSRTLASQSFVELLGRLDGGAQVIVQPCPGLVEKIESGDLYSTETRSLLDRYLAPLLARGADTIVLGCTHYPHLRPLIHDLVGSTILVVDSGAAVARQVKRRLAELDRLCAAPRMGTEQFWTTGDPGKVSAVIAALWPSAAAARPLPESPPAEPTTG